ncbi:hypothetical protein S40285_01041 [Stachybotrys chlorohalonatus IBT 40285]|uniref:Methyltransferase type 11 domain-containing protein n=1 Tax=Stachybotrys chlorohalonatus (strain IBT 40285) TaxID=1283841 RepID=A0A084QK94_STAC4|nr:hypothetical protein S40285_01041 [Stachybotrys chlorohalonata IBT 40285]
MAGTLRLAPQRYQPQESSLARRQKNLLNPIIEEDSEDGRIHRSAMGRQGMRADTSHLKIQAWLSPMSDHFPTPRGNNFLSAPILPSSPSTESAPDSSPTTSSNRWNRASTATDNTEFEDLYDVSDQEDDIQHTKRQSASGLKIVTSHPSHSSRQPTPLVIPKGRETGNETWSAVDEFKKLTSPVQLTPSVNIPMSPAQLDFMGQHQYLEVPTISAPPSLDGSLNSDQLAAMSAPATPVIGNDEITTDEAWGGVQLQPGALATLHALSNNEDLQEQPAQVLEVHPEPPQPVSEMRQQPARLITQFTRSLTQGQAFSPNPNRQSLADLTKLDIPSPGGFFSGLSPRSRMTWHLPAKSPEDIAPPTSTTAEQFYRCPWNMDASVPPVPAVPVMPKQSDPAEWFYRSIDEASAPVEQVIEVQEDNDLEDDMPTARPVFEHSIARPSVETVMSPASPTAEEAATEIVVDYDPGYARKQQEEALSHMDRTGLWLVAQRAYLKGVDVEGDDDAVLQTIAEDPEEEEEPQEVNPEPAQDMTVKKKTVRFSNIIVTTTPPRRLPSKFMRQESAYYRAFQDYIVKTQAGDVFIHQLARFEALQAQRVSLRESHRNQLLGKYQLSVVPQSAKKRLSANVARGDEVVLDDPEQLRHEKEFEAMNQMAISTWHVAATKFLNGGRLITAPVTKRLARLSRVTMKDGVTRDRARILDLGGQATCDWAWHCALQYPNAKIYTVTTKAIRQLSNSNIRGPSNHRQVAIERFTRLPFPDNHFDLVSARELHSILKFIGENGEDEWEGCLEECMRVLKPGGYLDFSLLDSDIMNAGPLGLAKSVEFGFTLKTLGYDPSPTKLWLRRLARAGFQDTRRMWMCLPMGARRATQLPPTPPLKDSPTGEGVKTCQMDALFMGSTDAIANACSIVGGWSWERWLLRCEMEKVAGELRLADTVTTGAAMREAGKCLDGFHAVVEEGRNCRSGFRMLNGYARKPDPDTEVIQIALGESW